MTQLERQIRTAQRRLWLNRWLDTVCRSMGVAAATYAFVVLVQRLFDAPVPLSWLGLGFGAAVILWSIFRTIVTREGATTAAAVLDEAAGLRERIGSGHYCLEMEDPFARAVVADAERASASITVRKHIRLSVPRPLALTAGAVLVAALMFLITPGLLKRSEAVEVSRQKEELERTQVAVKRKLDSVRRIAEKTPALEDLKDELEALDKQAGGKLGSPADTRHNAIKKIDKLADAVKKKRSGVEYGAVKEMRKMLRGLKAPKDTNAPTQKLANALAQGDFKAAKEEIQALREQLATLKSEQDKLAVARLSKQLTDIAKQLEALAKNEKLATKLTQAGIKKEDVDRLLEHLKKKDIDQLKKQLAEKGLSQRQIDKLAKQLQQRQQAGATANKLAQAIQQGAQAANTGQLGEALAGLSQAGEQLSELEQLEAEMIQLESTLAMLQDAQAGLDKPCNACAGTGMRNGQPCSSCQGAGRGDSGGGMGLLGQGRGGLAPEQQTSVGFKIERGKVHTGKGAIIGQFLFDGDQVKGEVDESFAEIVSAAQREASDRINRDRIPRQYHKAVKSYFSNVQRSIERLKSRERDASGDAVEVDAVDEPADQTRDNTEEKD